LRKFVERLLRHKNPNTGKEEPAIITSQNQPKESMDIEKPKHLFDVPQFIVGCSQSVGKQREHNEDALFILSSTLVNDGHYLPFGLFIVADGMGGHKHGEIASNLAVRCTASQVIQKILMSLLALQPTAPSESIQEILESSVHEAHQTIIRKAPESGSTLTVLLILDKLMSIAHVGDSRAYIVSPDGTMQTLTHDHSLVMRLMELGQLTEEEASAHPQRNVLYRAMGYGETFTPDISTSPLPETGYILMCSDGLWGVVPQEEISRLIIDSPDVQIACQRLIDAANDAGGPDNISVILVRIPEQAA
jgi:serine/threonine protein phosphatase PrpC